MNDDIEQERERGRREGAEGKDRELNSPFPYPGESSEHYEARQAAYDDGFFQSIGEKDGASGAFLKSDSGYRVFESEKSNKAREKSYSYGYKKGISKSGHGNDSTSPTEETDSDSFGCSSYGGGGSSISGSISEAGGFSISTIFSFVKYGLIAFILFALVSNVFSCFSEIAGPKKTESITKKNQHKPTTPQMVIRDAGSFTDIDGNVYRAIQIGDQIWATENLKVSRYRNGDPITHARSFKEWKSAKKGEGKYCYYQYDSSYSHIYGYYYSWHAVNDSRQLAPEGWHIPSKTEWETLLNYLEGNQKPRNNIKVIKQLRDNLNRYMNVQFAGHRSYSLGNFFGVGDEAFIWSSTESPYTSAWDGSYDKGYALHLGVTDRVGGYNKNEGFSIRCIKN